MLLLSSVGYKAQEIKVSNTSLVINVRLEINESPLDEVQIIAYGTTSQRLGTGNVSTVRSEDIAKQPVSNPLAAMIGRVPGLLITQNSGTPGGGFNIQIRGRNSIQNGNDPFFIVDGVPYASKLLPNMGNDILGQTNSDFVAGAGNPLNFISPSEIESISILKDADATAIYGSRGANGVVLITTKRGKQGKAKATINLSSGVGRVANKLNLLNTKEYLQLRREAFQNDGATPDSIFAPDLMMWDTTRYTDWQNELIGGSANYLDAQVNLSGGTENIQYLIGGNFHRETTVMPGDFSDQKGSIHFNINTVSLNRKFKVAMSGNYLIDNNRLPRYDLTRIAKTLAPNSPEIYNADGSFNWENDTWQNPLAQSKQAYISKTNNLISNMSLSYELFKGLLVKSTFGYTNTMVNEITTYPISIFPPGAGITGESFFTTNNVKSWIVEPQGVYQFDIGNGRGEVLVGATFQENNSIGNIIHVTGYTSDALLQNIQAGPDRSITSVTNSTYKYNAAFARFNYNWRDKYILNLNARRDGSSRFGSNNRFANFGSIGTSWIFTEEKWFKKTFPFFTFGKLRLTYGTTGSDQISDYAAYDLFGTLTYSYLGVVGLTPSNLFNPNVEWEETRKFETGMELGFLSDRILLNIVYYKNRSSNQLLSNTLPLTTGFGIIASNLPAIIQNTGWEFSINSSNIETKRFSWSTSINLSVPRNKLVDFPNIQNTGFANTLVIGKPINIKRVISFRGVDPVTGVYQFTDRNGSPTFNPLPYYFPDNDATKLVSLNADYFGGIGNKISFGNWMVDFHFQFIKQIGNSYLFATNGVVPGFAYNIDKEFLKRWQKPGDITTIEQVTQSYISNALNAYNYLGQSDIAYEDASFIRLKNLAISYNLPAALTKRINLQNCRFYIVGQNLLTFTKYKGLDPENNGSEFLPPLRMLVAGIEVSL